MAALLLPVAHLSLVGFSSSNRIQSGFFCCCCCFFFCLFVCFTSVTLHVVSARASLVTTGDFYCLHRSAEVRSRWEGSRTHSRAPALANVPRAGVSQRFKWAPAGHAPSPTSDQWREEGGARVKPTRDGGRIVSARFIYRMITGGMNKNGPAGGQEFQNPRYNSKTLRNDPRWPTWGFTAKVRHWSAQKRLRIMLVDTKLLLTPFCSPYRLCSPARFSVICCFYTCYFFSCGYGKCVLLERMTYSVRDILLW